MPKSEIQHSVLRSREVENCGHICWPVWDTSIYLHLQFPLLVEPVTSSIKVPSPEPAVTSHMWACNFWETHKILEATVLPDPSVWVKALWSSSLCVKRMCGREYRRAFLHVYLGFPWKTFGTFQTVDPPSSAHHVPQLWPDLSFSADWCPTLPH